MNKLLPAIAMMVFAATTGAQGQVNNLNDEPSLLAESSPGFTLIPLPSPELASEASCASGIFFCDKENNCIRKLSSSNVAYDKNNISGIPISILNYVVKIGEDILKSPGVREYIDKLNNLFSTTESVFGIANLLASGNINTERLIIQGAHSPIVIPLEMNSGSTFRFNLSGPSENEEADYFKTMAKSPQNVRCIKLKSKKGAFRSFPRGLKIEAFGATLVKDKKGGKTIDFEVIRHEGDNYEVRFPRQLEEGDYCFLCNDPSNDLFNGRLIVCDFTVEKASVKEKPTPIVSLKNRQ